METEPNNRSESTAPACTSLFMKENITTDTFSNHLSSHHYTQTVALVTVIHWSYSGNKKEGLKMQEAMEREHFASFGRIILYWFFRITADK